MPITVPTIDTRTYQQLVDEALARVPVHTPEWTNFNESDPGVTLIEVFAFVTESLLYRANQIPERNRKKFLQLLGVPLTPASPAVGLVALANERGPREVTTIPADTELSAGKVPFRTERTIDVAPVESRVFLKRRLTTPDPQLVAYYQQLYASYGDSTGADTVDLDLYETVQLDGASATGVDLTAETVDATLWIALLVRAADQPEPRSPEGWEKLRNEVRERLAGKTLSLGLVPVLEASTRTLPPGGGSGEVPVAPITYELPSLPPGGRLPEDPTQRVAAYRQLDARGGDDALLRPSVVELLLPANVDELKLWTNLDPLEPGVGTFPPSVADTALADRIVTWVRVRPAAGARFLWAGINAVPVTQRVRVRNERLEPGTGDPDQVRHLARRPIVPGSVSLTVARGDTIERWTEIDDLFAAGSEIVRRDPLQPPTVRPPQQAESRVFALDPEAAELQFGDGIHGARPPFGAELRASYDSCLGAAGNIGKGAINAGPGLPAGFTVANPIATWLGADAQTVTDGEKFVARYIQHRDRLVTAADFETLTLNAPGIELGRVEVLPAFHPDLSPNEPGDAPGVVTLLIIPRYDARQPDAPLPDRLLLDALCHYLDPRRLVTTELVLRGPTYVPLWISVGIEVKGGFAVPDVRDAVKERLKQFLAPRRAAPVDGLDADLQKGWPLRRAVTERQLTAEVSRVPGVLQVNALQLAGATGEPRSEIPLRGLELPRTIAIAVVRGDPQPIDDVRGAPAATPATRRSVPVPVIPERC